MQTVATYFNLPDAADLTWAHRVNTPLKLEQSVADATLHVLEADVQFDEADATPLIAEPKAMAELDLATFIATAAHAGKAVKLDFHSAAAVEPTLAILRRMRPATPVILHADVFTLLASNNPEQSLDPEQFLRLAYQACPQAVLSLGWSLKRTHDADGRVEEALIHQMSAMLHKNLPLANYALEIRAGYTPGRGGTLAEHGGAMLFDPLPSAPPPDYACAPNVVEFLPRLRQVA